MEHCTHCHRPVFIKGAKVPPYYNCQLSPRPAAPANWSEAEGQSSGQNSLVFRRSCSTRKKIRTDPSEGEAGSFFRYEECLVFTVITLCCVRSVMSHISPSQRPDNNRVEFSRSGSGEEVRINGEKDRNHDYLHPLNNRERFKRVLSRISPNEDAPEPSLALKRNSWGSTLPDQ